MRWIFLNCRFFHVYFFLLHSLFHWKKREKAMSEILDSLNLNPCNEPICLLDVGCGPGLLVDQALQKGFSYLGIDTDPATIDYCRNKYANIERVTFINSTIPSQEISINSNHVVIFNMVFHHLEEKTAKEIFSHVSKAKFIIISDHFRDKTIGRWPKLLQKLDRGKFVRQYSFFRNIDGFRPLKSLIFPIKIFSFVFWVSFCISYIPEARD